MRLSRAQRDFLATYSEEMMVDVEPVGEGDGEIRVTVVEGDVLDEANVTIVPPEGFSDQPSVRIEDPEKGGQS